MLLYALVGRRLISGFPHGLRSPGRGAEHQYDGEDITETLTDRASCLLLDLNALMLALRLHGDRAECHRALARTRDAGEQRQPALRDVEAEVLDIAHARALHAEQMVAVCNV
jgi:hypothetical protein